MRDLETYPGLARTPMPLDGAGSLRLLAPELLESSHLDTLDDPVETALYARLVSLAVKTLCARSVLDVGCGCGIPTLAAARSGASRVVGIDIVARNVELARTNIRRARLQERVSALHGSWEDVCAGRLDVGACDLIVANPPYVPSGLGIVVDGGAKGTHMIDAILDGVSADVSGLALLFGSISDPLAVLDRLARRGFEVCELLVQSVPFGRYTSPSATLAHLKRLREQGSAWFCDTSRTGDAAPHAYLTLGAVAKVSRTCVLPGAASAGLADLLAEYQHRGPGVVPEGPWLLDSTAYEGRLRACEVAPA